MATSTPKPKPQNNGLNLSDLGGDITKPIIFPGGHYGLESAVWESAQRVADLLPVKVQVSGDLDEQTVFDATENAKGAEIQAKCWTEYSAAISRYLKTFYKIREKQSETAENVAETRLKVAQLEKDLGTTLASLESQYRQVVGSYRSSIASTQDDLTINLNKIASQYTQLKAKKEERLETEAKKEETPFAKQTTSLVEKFRKAREARYSGASAGITRRAAV